MAKLPTVTGGQAVAAFVRAGFALARIDGSHHVLTRPGHRLNLSVPVHGNRPIASGTLRKLIRDAGLTVDAFIALLK